MRPTLLTALLTTASLSVTPTTWATPLLTMQYQIGTLSRTLQFMADGSVAVACDGSVALACDGSVAPVPDASFRTMGDGSVRTLTPLQLLADGSVKTGDALPSDTDAIFLSALDFSPNPFLSGSVAFGDFGAPTTFVITFGGPLILGTNAFDYTLSGDVTLTDETGDGISAGEVSQFGKNGLIFGAVDLVGLASLGASGVSGPGLHSLASATGSGNCVACANQYLAIGLAGSGGGDKYSVNAKLDLQPASRIPEPGTLGLLGLGLAAFFVRGRQSRKCSN